MECPLFGQSEQDRKDSEALGIESVHECERLKGPAFAFTNPGPRIGARQRRFDPCTCPEPLLIKCDCDSHSIPNPVQKYGQILE